MASSHQGGSGKDAAAAAASVDWTAIPETLLSEFASENVAVFVGAGFTAPAGFPGWKNLLLTIADLGCKEGTVSADLKAAVQRLLKADSPGAHELDQAAQMLNDAVNLEGTPDQTELVEMLIKCLGPRSFPLPPVMERRLQILRELPCTAILTTNYNPLLRGVTPFDAAAKSAYRRVLRNADGSNAPARGAAVPAVTVAENRTHAVAASNEQGLQYVPVSWPVVQIHGNLENPQSVVLSREGYRRLLFACPNYMTFIRSCFSARSILFVGCSFSDAYINELRSEIVSLFGSEGPPLCYAIVPDYSPIECQFRLEHEGMRCITFDTTAPEGWGGFDRVWEALASAVKQHRRT